MTIKNITLAELAAGLPGTKLVGDGRVKVSGIAYDSRKVQPGDLFAAIPGVKADGTQFIDQAVTAGAAAALAVKAPERVRVPVLEARELRKALGQAAGRFYGHPDHELILIGITGTNGKTTISYLLEAIIQAAGGRPGVIGTVNYRFAESAWPADNTTPESVDVFKILAEIRLRGATHAVMEVSSHALDQARVSGLWFRRAIFTNLSRDHLDYHKGFEEYYQAKKKLFSEVLMGAWAADVPRDGPKPIAAVNLDDEYGKRLDTELKAAGVPVHGFGIESKEARVRATDTLISDRETKATVVSPEGTLNVSSPLLGRHNVENILAAVTVALSLGISGPAIEQGLRQLGKVPGRLEPAPNAAGITVLVDYAHTPDALSHAVGTCKALTRGKLITVFGCGGDRDRGKRPLMGRIAVQGSDLAIVTSDNPRTEDPDFIIQEILNGVKTLNVVEGKNYQVQPDRRKAIQLAIATARPGDLVLIAGKGHEDYQILGATKIHFDDREEAAKALEERKK